jgi:hypothetical protein
MTSGSANSGRLKQIARSAGASRRLPCYLLLGLVAISALGGAEQPSYKPPPIACELRYHFRERLRGDKVEGKRVSAPSYEREALQPSRINVSDGSVSQVVDGRSAHLPYRFLVKLTRKSESDQGSLEINVADASGKSLPGFPKRMENPFATAEDSGRVYFEIPVAAEIRKSIEKNLLAKAQFLTYVDLAVGASK